MGLCSNVDADTRSGARVRLARLTPENKLELESAELEHWSGQHKICCHGFRPSCFRNADPRHRFAIAEIGERRAQLPQHPCPQPWEGNTARVELESCPRCSNRSDVEKPHETHNRLFPGHDDSA